MIMFSFVAPLDSQGTQCEVTISGPGPMREYYLNALLEYLHLARTKLREQNRPVE